MRAVHYSYDIPKGKSYPNPSPRLRPFAVRMQFSCWLVPLAEMYRTNELSADVKRLGGKVDTIPFEDSETSARKIREIAIREIQSEAERIRNYLEKGVVKTQKRLAEAQAQMSVGGVNKAISFQAGVLSVSLRDVKAAEECCVVFDLTGELSDLVRGVRALVEARSTAFVPVRDAARSAVKVMDPNNITFGSPVLPTQTDPTTTTPADDQPGTDPDRDDDDDDDTGDDSEQE
jgi:hypothetical protein